MGAPRRLLKEYSGPPPVLAHGYRDATVLAPRRSDDAIAVAMARNSNNGGTTRSAVGAVPPQPINV